MLLALPLLLQAPPGGEWEVLHTTHATQYEGHGNNMDWIGDADGDGYSDYILSSSLYQATGQNRGIVYLYSGRTGALLDSLTGDAFPYPYQVGQEVSRMGDVTGDGRPEIAVTKLRLGLGGGPSTVLTLSLLPFTVVHESASPHLDSHVGMGGLAGGTDLNGDGFPDLLAGDPGYTEGGVSVGAVHAFDGLTGILLWRARGLVIAQSFGETVIGPGDVDGDGHADVVTRSYLQGATVHVLSGADGSEMYSFLGDYSYSYIGLGRLAPCGDADGDGLPDYLVGQDEVTGVSKGMATIHRGYDGAIIHRWEGQVAGQNFGNIVACPGDLNGDGKQDYAIWAPGSGSGNHVNRIYVFSGRDYGLLRVLISPSPNEMGFGYPIANLGFDVTDDGSVELLTADGAEPYNGVFGSGVSYLFSFDKHLTADALAVSAATGGVVRFALDFPVSEAGRAYRLLASDDLPGSLTVNGVGIPLTNTPLLQRFLTAPPPVFDAPVGILDANGDAVVTATIPASALTAFVGRSIQFAAVSLSTPNQPSRSSAAVWLAVTP